jgi:hypothetical protein
MLAVAGAIINVGSLLTQECRLIERMLKKAVSCVLAVKASST